VDGEVGLQAQLSELSTGIALDFEKRSDHEEKKEGSRWAMRPGP
jgi:hypothetical protein